MAESLEALEDNVRCSICFEVYREPVSLPCKHSYCRECLQAFADTQDKSTPSEQSDPVILCPQCRAVTHLGENGVAGLPTDMELVEYISKIQPTETCKEIIPMCSMCDDTSKAEAEKYCPSCGLFYCSECLPFVHPIRGVFKNHTLINVQEHLSTTKEDKSQPEQADHTPTCEQHEEPYSIFCVKCHTVICNGCLVDHNKHPVSDLTSARDELKDAKQLDVSIASQLSEIKTAMKTHDDIGKKLRSSLKSHPVVSREVRVLEAAVSPSVQPVLKFTKTNQPDLHISDSGCTVVCNSVRRGTDCTAWTDGRITSGQITWGVEVTVPPSSHNPVLFCVLGITREGCSLYSNPGHTSWYVEMCYYDNQVRYEGSINCSVDVTPDYYDYYPPTGPAYRLGVCLNCDNKTLILTDCDQNKVMATVRGINMSEPVIPAVGFDCRLWGSGSVTARLFPWNGSPLP